MFLWSKVLQNIEKFPQKQKANNTTTTTNNNKNSREEIHAVKCWSLLTYGPTERFLIWPGKLFSLSSHGQCIASVNKSFQEQRTWCMGHLGGGHWDFRFGVLAIFQIGFSVCVPKNFGFSVLVFIAVCRFFVF